MGIRESLLDLGISFRKGEEHFTFPVDEENPTMPAAKFFLEKAVLGKIGSAWKQWKAMASMVLSTAMGRSFISQFFTGEAVASQHSAPETDGWTTRQRSELDLYTPGQDYFFGPHVTRIDFGLNRDNQLVIIDPNVMPYGVAPMVAAQEILGIRTQEAYLDQLRTFGPTWVTDRSHGSAHSLKWLTDRAGVRFSFSDEFVGADNVVRLSRMNIKGGRATVGAPGIRIFESQIWNALLNIPGLPESFGFKPDLAIHRSSCAPCFLIRLQDGFLKVAFSFGWGGDLQWVGFEDFVAAQWALGKDKVFLKCLATSGCRQVTFSNIKERDAVKAIQTKLGASGYFLLQPALPCLVDGERVRVSSYLGSRGEHYGSEVTRVPSENRLAHGGSHAKISYLVL